MSFLHCCTIAVDCDIGCTVICYHKITVLLKTNPYSFVQIAIILQVIWSFYVNNVTTLKIDACSIHNYKKLLIIQYLNKGIKFLLR